MSTQPVKKHTLEEYFAIEAASQERSQYYRGEIFAMPGGSLSHSRVSRNLNWLVVGLLNNSSCEFFGEGMRVFCSSDLYTYADGLIVCGEPLFDGRGSPSLVNPLVIFEVLSPSTERFDRGQKFQHYQAIATLREYVLIAQTAPQIVHFIKTEEGDWQSRLVPGLESTLELSFVKCPLPLADIYHQVVFD